MDHNDAFAVFTGAAVSAEAADASISRKSFGRTLSLIASPDCSESVFDLVSYKVRSELGKQVIVDMHSAIPWLKDQFTLIK